MLVKGSFIPLCSAGKHAGADAASSIVNTASVETAGAIEVEEMAAYGDDPPLIE
jgi:hypothetical protein